LSFDGDPCVTIPAGEVRVSDALDYPLRALGKLAITICFGSVPRAITGHPGSRTTSYVKRGHAATAESLESAVSTEHWYIIAGIDVLAAAPSAAVVMFGDSITDGRGSTTDGNDRWPDNLARRLRDHALTKGVAVLNQGIGGNAVLSAGLGPTAVDRFDRDVLGPPGVRWLVVLAGVNDLCTSKSSAVAGQLIRAYQEFIEKAHARGIRVYGVPILPIGGSHYDAVEHEAARQRVNHWLRSSAALDAVIDLEAAVRDPSHPTRLLPSYDSGDQLHLSVAGYQAMADAIDLGLFVA
jgi:lysophospholipase L1-like esterase